MAGFQKPTRLMHIFLLLCSVSILTDADIYRSDKVSTTFTNVNKLFASTDVDSAIHCALKCQEFNCTSFTYGEKLGPSTCYNTTSQSYDGRQSTTNSGVVCQRWDSQTPHDHPFVFGFPEPFVSDAQNFCRDPDDEGIPWCFTVNQTIKWEPCPVKKCTFSKCLFVANAYIYNIGM
ncbi:hypothetical protein ACF0H5_011651 [Mactra antiquata]